MIELTGAMMYIFHKRGNKKTRPSHRLVSKSAYLSASAFSPLTNVHQYSIKPMYEDCGAVMATRSQKAGFGLFVTAHRDCLLQWSDTNTTVTSFT